MKEGVGGSWSETGVVPSVASRPLPNSSQTRGLVCLDPVEDRGGELPVL